MEPEAISNAWGLYNQLENEFSQYNKELEAREKKTTQVIVKIAQIKNENVQLAQAIAAANVQRDQLQQQLSQMRTESAQSTSVLKALKNEIEHKKKKVSSSVTDDQLHKYKDALSFSCTSIKGEALALLFRNVNKSVPEQVFEVDIALKDNTFAVVRCIPMVPILNELESELLSSNNLSLFVTKLRKEWQEQLKVQQLQT